jgi:hypothetical protein
MPLSRQQAATGLQRSWSHRTGLNCRPAVYETAALPLSYDGLFAYRHCRRLLALLLIWSLAATRSSPSPKAGRRTFSGFVLELWGYVAIDVHRRAYLRVTEDLHSHSGVTP